MNEKYVLSYLDLVEDKFKVLYFNTESEAIGQLKIVKSNPNIMSEMVMSESRYEQHEMDMAILDEEYDY